MSKKVTFFLDNYLYNGTTFWINWATKQLGLDTVIATNGFIADKNSSNFVFMSKMEGMRSIKDRLAIAFPSQDICSFLYLTTSNRMLYIDNLTFLYPRFKNEKYDFINKIEQARENGAKIVSSVQDLGKFGIVCDKVILPFDKEAWNDELCS